MIFDDEEEQWFFTNAKKIKMQNKKNVVPVHSYCLKQIEMNRELQKQAKLFASQGDSSQLTDSIIQQPSSKAEEEKAIENDEKGEKNVNEVIYERNVQ